MSLLSSILVGGQRSYGTLIPHVVVSEQHRDDLVITDHPVERGAAISDHAFKRPSIVEVRCAWSDTKSFPGYVQLVYQEFLALQEKREPFDVMTGKRSYSNMLVASLSVTTDDKSETALMVQATFREIIIVATQSTSGSKETQKQPQTTAQTTDSGVKQPVAVPSGSPYAFGPQSGLANFGVNGPNPPDFGTTLLPSFGSNTFDFTSS